MNMTEPKYGLSAFNCPCCGAYAEQKWSFVDAAGTFDRAYNSVNKFSSFVIDDMAVSKCSRCSQICIWYEEELIHPKAIVVEMPNVDLPEDIRKDYLEAANIAQYSPRGAAALLRLCIQKLCKELGEKGKNLNDDIGKLVKKGLSADIVKAMDLLRVTGDNAVHPGEIDLNDRPEIAFNLFKIVNFIAEKMITEPRRLTVFYDEVMPQGAKDAVSKRDKNGKNEKKT